MIVVLLLTLFSVAAVVVAIRVAAGARSVRCVLRNRCTPVRHPLGGYRCSTCGIAGESLGDFLGYAGSGGYVTGPRRIYDQDGVFTRTHAWEPDSRGRW